MALSWIEHVIDMVRDEGTLARVSVMRADGSTPREAGAAMLVTRLGLSGTIGGGALEHDAIARARRLILDAHDAGAGTWVRHVERVPLGPALGQCCGGATVLLLEIFGTREAGLLAAMIEECSLARAVVVRPVETGAPIRLSHNRKDAGAEGKPWPLPVTRAVRAILSGGQPLAPVLVRGALVRGAKGSSEWFIEPAARQLTPLYLFGAGHVGRALVRVLDGLPFAITWIDTAASRFPGTIRHDVTVIAMADPAAVVARAEPHAFHLVMTYSHAIDLAICHAVLGQGRFGYLGLIGSQTKRARFLSRLASAGIAPSVLSRMHCPIGLEAFADHGLVRKEPGVIAVSVAADLIQRTASCVHETLSSTTLQSASAGDGSQVTA